MAAPASLRTANRLRLDGIIVAVDRAHPGELARMTLTLSGDDAGTGDPTAYSVLPVLLDAASWLDALPDANVAGEGAVAFDAALAALIDVYPDVFGVPAPEEAERSVLESVLVVRLHQLNRCTVTRTVSLRTASSPISWHLPAR
jgi:hypothetical protein